jgi:hypothetical protein
MQRFLTFFSVPTLSLVAKLCLLFGLRAKLHVPISSIKGACQGVVSAPFDLMYISRTLLRGLKYTLGTHRPTPYVQSHCV